MQIHPAFLSVIANEADAPNSPDLTNTGLTDGVNAQIIDGDEDVMAYTGLRNNLSSFAAYAAQISNDANWTTADGTGDQSGGFLPFNATPFETANVPEPISLAMVGCGILGMMLGRRRRHARSSFS
ncbi:MAG: PEP-CTERM sorting domain-containing protein [Planctomycetaceae bacterium]